MFFLKRKFDTKKREKKPISPNQQRTLNKLPSELRCRDFVYKHRLSIQIDARRAKTFMQCVHIQTELPFSILFVVGVAS